MCTALYRMIVLTVIGWLSLIADDAWGATPEPIGAVAPPAFALTWKEVQPGVELGMTALPEDALPAIGNGAEGPDVVLPSESAKPPAPDSGFILIRIDPARYIFTLHMASEDGPARSLGEWAGRYNLIAAINAGMYLPDNSTNTGYMRRGAHVNNAHVGSKLGAFFVSMPKKDAASALASVDILERGDAVWEERLEQYDMVVQNYRLVSREGRTLWAEGGPEHSTAAIAKDARGKILFILCRKPLPPARFAAYLRGFSLSLGTVMYVEGGAQAGLFLLQNGTPTTWMGRQSIIKTAGNPFAPLPNIIGIRAR